MNPIILAKHVLDNEIKGLENLRDNLDRNFLKALDMMQKRKGRILISGVGKSGIIGKKIAASLLSIGTDAFFLNPVDALHGDLGVVKKGDVCIFISHSGESAEILKVAAHLKKIKIPIISITGNPRSRLSRLSDAVINTYVKEEACKVCSFNLVPTTSTLVSHAIGDAITLILMENRAFTLNQFSRVHPAGKLGKISKKK